jgi:type II secretory pathway pseudopilin PulG
VGSGQCETASGCLHPSSFIPHPSSFGPHPYKPGNKLPGPHAGYTLVEILVATAITLLLMGAVVQMFGSLGQSITDSRSFLEASERLNSAAARLQMDLKGVTVKMLPPRNPDDGEGYFEYIEGPMMQKYNTQNRADYDWITNPLNIYPKPVNSENTQPVTATTDPSVDTTVGDFDDILMFTTRSTGRPFVGLYNGAATQSDVAEVAWFIRGRTLHRRQLLVSPALTLAAAAGFYRNNDISVRMENGHFLANTLSDLTRRECRFAHPITPFPFDARYWGQLGLPTLRECSDPTWIAGILNGTLPATSTIIDFWSNVTSPSLADNALNLAGNGSRIADDVILTNVIGFDVKAWDPGANGGAGDYVDLGNNDMAKNPSGFFTGFGMPKSMLQGSANTARVYDTWSTHYETVGLLGLDPTIYPPGRGTNGFDDDGNGIVDDDGEKITSPPYPYPLRGIQVKIRVFEPDSRQIRELTIIQDFLPK